MKNDRAITVLGAGVSGLSTALALSEKGYRVQIITKDLPAQTTSAVAAAIWFPYEVFPRSKAGTWSLASFKKFKELAKIEAAGVSFIPFTVFLDTYEIPWWLKALPSSYILDKDVPSPVHPDHVGYTLNVPLIESPVYLTYLLQRLKETEVTITQKEIQSLDELSANNPIINCTGLGAKELCNDEQLFPIQGQVVKVERSANIQGFATEYTMGKNENETAYIIPRRDCLVLGGSAKKHHYSTAPDAELTKRIIEYCAEFRPEVKKLVVKESLVGLRPGRTEIRLEKDPQLPIIHNYGHGGAGYTVSWGCAFEVVNLVEGILG